MMLHVAFLLAFVAAFAIAPQLNGRELAQVRPNVISKGSKPMSSTAKSDQSLPSKNQALAVTLETEPRYVSGLPMPMAIILKVTQPGTVSRLLPEPKPYALGGCIGFVLFDVNGQTVAQFEPPGRFSLDHDAPSLTLASGEQRRFLIDLSEIMAEQKPGRYRLTVIYAAPARRAQTPAVVITIQPATEQEKAWIERHRLAVTEAGSWGRWATLPPTADTPIEPPASAPVLAQFVAVSRFVFYEPATLDRLDPSVFDLVDGLPYLEAQSMKIEVFRASKSNALADHVIDKLSTVPALRWLVDKASNRTGIVAAYRFAP